MDLKTTIEMMQSDDYKERFKAEYHQTKIRYERLKKLNTQIEAAERAIFCPPNRAGTTMAMPNHDCPADLLRQQQSIMGEYLHILEVRAEIEGIVL